MGLRFSPENKMGQRVLGVGVEKRLKQRKIGLNGGEGGTTGHLISASMPIHGLVVLLKQSGLMQKSGAIGLLKLRSSLCSLI
jgi:hypothetical protein